MKTKLRLACALTAAFLASSCGAETVTSVLVTVDYQAEWNLTGFVATLGDELNTIQPTRELLFLVPDSWGGQSLELEVVGLRGGKRYAVASARVTPVAGTTVATLVVLTRVPCGAWCTPGTTQCGENGFETCAANEADGCLEWGPVVDCPSEEPFCSLGRCSSTCIDECASGETRCVGPDEVATCGQADADDCLDWLPSVNCEPGASCSSGTCGTTCRNECEEGATRCLGAGTAECHDLNLDGCTEWGPEVTCEAGNSCSDGFCVPIGECVDECSESACEGNVLSQCGNYDLDPCLELSPGASCEPADPCLEGTCVETGCEVVERACEEAPAPTCFNAMTLRSSAPVGMCSGGECEYTETDTTCPFGCEAGGCIGGCDGVVCNDSGNDCLSNAGTCMGDGMCSYPPDDEATCDDLDPCTVSDACSTGACAGTAMACDTPDAPTCADANTLRTYTGAGSCTAGACSYGSTVMNCPAGCRAGACELECGPGLTGCGGSCRDLVTDRANCGRCGTICASSETCVSGGCIETATFTFPEFGDTRVTDRGPSFYTAGDYVAGLRSTSLLMVRGIDLDLQVRPNSLSCDTQDVRLTINGTEVATAMIRPFDTSIRFNVSFPPIAGPNYAIRVQTISTVTAACGAAGYPNGVSPLILTGF